MIVVNIGFFPLQSKTKDAVLCFSCQTQLADNSNTAEKRIKGKKRLRPSVIITDAISGFSDPNFWGEYNLIEPDKSIESAIEKIKKSIERQRQKEERTANGNP